MAPDTVWAIIAIAGFVAGSVAGWFYLKCLYPDKNKMNIVCILLNAILLLMGLFLYHPGKANYGIWILIPMMSIITIEDIIARRVSNKILIIMLAVGLLFVLTNGKMVLAQLIAPVMYGIIFVIISLVSRGGLGMGDAKLIAILAAYYGLICTCNVILIASIAECIVSVFVLTKTKDLRTEIPFAPAIQFGAIVALIWLV